MCGVPAIVRLRCVNIMNIVHFGMLPNEKLNGACGKCNINIILLIITGEKKLVLKVVVVVVFKF